MFLFGISFLLHIKWTSFILMASRGQNGDDRSHLLIFSNFLSKSRRCFRRENNRHIFSVCPSVTDFRVVHILTHYHIITTPSETCSVTAANDVVVWRNQKSASVNALLKYLSNMIMSTRLTWSSFIEVGRLQQTG